MGDANAEIDTGLRGALDRAVIVAFEMRVVDSAEFDGGVVDPLRCAGVGEIDPTGIGEVALELLPWQLVAVDASAIILEQVARRVLEFRCVVVIASEYEGTGLAQQWFERVLERLHRVSVCPEVAGHDHEVGVRVCKTTKPIDLLVLAGGEVEVAQVENRDGCRARCEDWHTRTTQCEGADLVASRIGKPRNSGEAEAGEIHTPIVAGFMP